MNFYLFRALSMFCLVLLAGCASNLPAGSQGELRKKMYLDANLGFTLAVPEDWKRTFITPPPSSPAPYSVLWSGSIPGDPGKVVETLASTLPPGPLVHNREQFLADFVATHPRFMPSEHFLLEDVLFPTEEILGETPERQYRLYHIATRDRTYQLAFSVPKDHFQEYLPLFDLIFNSFSILE